jgi:hypothetical protein
MNTRASLDDCPQIEGSGTSTSPDVCTDDVTHSLPFMINQRGDSGRPMMNTRIIRANKIWSAIGKRQETVEGSVKDIPKSIQ